MQSFKQKRMRRISTLASLLLITVSLLANNPITNPKALRKAQDFAQKKGHVKNTATLEMAYAITSTSEKPGIFVYNMGNHAGFVIVSDDDSTDDVLGYSYTGHFDADHIPDNMRAWLEICAEETAIKDLDKTRTVSIGEQTTSVSTLTVRTAAKHSTEVIEPLITTHWGQWAPFNTQCPVIDGTQCPTGCTATALAQVMRYHAYPVGESHEIPSYKTRTSGLTVPALEATTFDWDLMTDELTQESDSASIAEVAKLMRYCGQANSMNYSTTGSGAYTYNIPETQPLYFDYPSTIHYESREAYDEAGWEELLINELLNGQPVIYTAYTNLNQGHTFICDGYDGNGYFHINWGWCGDGDGFYRISSAHAKGDNLNPNIKNYHLSKSQTALVGLKPSGDDTYTAPSEKLRVCSRPSLKAGRIYTRENAKKVFDGLTIKQSICNTSDKAQAFYYGLVIYNDDDSIVATLKSSSTSFKVREKKDYEATGLRVMPNIGNGHYTIKAVYKPFLSSPWQLMGGSEKNYVDVQITDTVMTLTPVPLAAFTVDSIRMEGSYMQIAYDNLNEDYFGPIYLRKQDPNTGTITTVSQDLLTSTNRTSDLYELYIDSSAKFDINNDRFYLSVDEYADQYFYSNEPADTFAITKQLEILNLNEDSTAIVGNNIICEVKLINEGQADFKDLFMMTLSDDKLNLTEVWRDTVEIAVGDTLTKVLVIPIEDFEREYWVKMSHHNGAYFWTTTTSDRYGVIEKDDTDPIPVPRPVQKGDVNEDGIVDVTDIMQVVGYILGQEDESFNADNADLNDDGIIDVTDTMLIVELILNQ